MTLMVGFAREDWVQTCTYNPYVNTIDEIPDRDCGDEAAFHILLSTDDIPWSAVLCCPLHFGIVKPTMVQGHSVDAICNMPGSIWRLDINKCVMDEPELQEARGEQAVNGSDLHMRLDELAGRGVSSRQD